MGPKHSCQNPLGDYWSLLGLCQSGGEGVNEGGRLHGPPGDTHFFLNSKKLFSFRYNRETGKDASSACGIKSC